MTERWGIAGGGMLGLTVALRLAEAGEKVDVVEAAPGVGGLASPWELGPVRWDRFYHVILFSDTYTRGLLGELGLEGELRWGATRTGFYAGGRVHSLTTPGDFLAFPVLNVWEKARLGATMVLAPRFGGGGVERVTALEWVGRWSGRGVVEKFWRPLLESKLGDEAERVAATFLYATMTRLGAARKMGVGREQFGYLPGGYGRVLEALVVRLLGLGVGIRTGTDFAAVRGEYGRQVVTVPAPVAAGMGPEFAGFAGVRYQGIVCSSFLLRRPLPGGFYVMNLGERGLPFTGVIDMTALVDAREFGGHGLVYLPRYVGSGDGVWGRTDGDVLGEAWAGLRRIYPELAEADRVAGGVARARHVFPLPLPGRSVPGFETPAAGVYAVNAAQIRNGTLNVNETVQLGERAARWLLERR